jgi:hypothetical protein
MSTKHPLVGKKVVPSNPQRGEVTKKQITDTLGKVAFVEANSWLAAIAENSNQQWAVTIDAKQIITDVRR